nr:hypothetical protein [Paenibacillus larvae]
MHEMGKKYGCFIGAYNEFVVSCLHAKKAANQADSSPAQGAQTQSELQPEAGAKLIIWESKEEKHSPNRLPRSLLKNIM